MGKLATNLIAICWAIPAYGAIVTGKVELISPSHAKPGDPSGVVVWLEPANGTTPPAIATSHRARMLQKDKTFSPHVLPIRVGSSVDFPNLDPIFHNAFSNFNGQIFDIGLYPPGKSRTVTFRKAGIVRVFCNIHPAMSAVIVVLNTDDFTVPGNDGSFTLSDVAPGQYTLHVWDERATPEALHQLSRDVTVDSDRIPLPAIRIPETGYIPATHANKFGKAYPRDSGESGYGVPK